MNKTLEQEIDELVTSAATSLNFYFMWGDVKSFRQADEIMSKFDYIQEPSDYTKEAIELVEKSGDRLEPFIVVKRMMHMGLPVKAEFETEVRVIKSKLKLIYDTSKFKDEEI
jgi:hypothetical protein